MPDLSNMCINVMTTPWSRVRHWSAPERLQWTSAEKTDAESFTAATTADLTTAPAFHLGCKSLNDINVLTTYDASEKTLQVYDDCDDEYFADFYPLDSDDPYSADPFDQDPILNHESEAMTSQEMGQSLLKFWSSVAASDKDNPSIRRESDSIEDDCLRETEPNATLSDAARNKRCLSDATSDVATKLETLSVPEMANSDYLPRHQLSDALPMPDVNGQTKMSHW